jgi:hypothetical protein
MDRRVPSPTNDSIDLYIRTYYSLLRSSGEVQVRSLEETHRTMGSSLHSGADSAEPDIGAFIYAAQRLPACMVQTSLVLLGQSREVFARRGYADVEEWQHVIAPGRRRRMFYDGKDRLAAYVASVSDIDDLIPQLVAYEIEWNKLYARLNNMHGGLDWNAPDSALARHALGLSEHDFARLHSLWKDALWGNLKVVAAAPKHMSVHLLASSVNDYRKATRSWWNAVLEHVSGVDLAERPVYFVSSNTHSLVNMLAGYARTRQDDMLATLAHDDPENLRDEIQAARTDPAPGRLNNLLYYLLRRYLARPGNEAELRACLEYELAHGVWYAHAQSYLDVDVQVFELNRFDPEHFDGRLAMPGLDRLRQSQAVIVNIDYPLGAAAYNILIELMASVSGLAGVYVMGKAATLNARVGDVMIPNVVFDQHSTNSYLFRNCFAASDVAPYLLHGTVFDNQKSVTVRGTFLQNRDFMHVFYTEGYTDIEMEAGPYLSAIYEDLAPKRHPVNEIVNLFLISRYDTGFLHYISDTPYSRRQELLSKSLSYFGMDSTYACAVAIVRRILQNEINRPA